MTWGVAKRYAAEAWEADSDVEWRLNAHKDIEEFLPGIFDRYVRAQILRVKSITALLTWANSGGQREKTP